MRDFGDQLSADQVAQIQSEHAALTGAFKDAERRRQIHGKRRNALRDAAEQPKDSVHNSIFGPRGAVAEVDKQIIQQQHATQAVGRVAESYLTDTDQGGVHAVSLIGLSGLGKTDILYRFAVAMGWKVSAEVNAGKAVDEPHDAMDLIDRALRNNRRDPGLIIINEVDKLLSIDPETGKPVERLPTFASYLADLLESRRGLSKMLGLTLNLPEGTYQGISPNPYISTNQDLMRVHRQLFPDEDSRHVEPHLGVLFRENFVQRLMKSHPVVLRPLDDEGVEELTGTRAVTDGFAQLTDDIKPVVDLTVVRHLAASYSPKNAPRLHLEMTGDELGAVANHAMRRIPKRMLGMPLKLAVRYDAADGHYHYQATPSQQVDRDTLAADGLAGYEGKVKSNAPYKVVPIPARKKLSLEQFRTAAQVLGQALAHAHFGYTFQQLRADKELAVVVGNSSTIANARDRWAAAFLGLSSRVMQHVMFAPNPRDLDESYGLGLINGVTGVEDIIRGLVTGGLHPRMGPFPPATMLVDGPRGVRVVPIGAELSAEPDRDHHNRSFVENQHVIAEIGTHMERFLLDHFLNAHSPEWYVEMASALARTKFFREEDFYSLIGYKHHGLEDGTWHDGPGLALAQQRGLAVDRKLLRATKIKLPLDSGGVTPSQIIDKGIESVRPAYMGETLPAGVFTGATTQ